MFIATLMTLAVANPKASQIHLAVGGAGSRDMVVTFRIDGAPEAQVCWGEHDLIHLASVRRNCSYWKGNYMSALLSPLKPKTKYLYVIVKGQGSSCANRVNLTDQRHFFAPPTHADAVQMLIYGDMGLGEMGNSVDSRMLLEDLKADADAVIHVGDISYADDSFLRPKSFFKFTYESIYDKWMNWVENITDRIPYMVSVGNHESECHSLACMVSKEKKEALGNFSAYNCRWHMPSEESSGALSMWYSYDFGPAHFVSINTETDFEGAGEEKYGDCRPCKIPAGSFGLKGAYLRWLENDLRKAHANRKYRPWIFAHGHRPLYTRGKPQCANAALCRSVEQLFYKYEVDVYISGHDHIYSRMSPKTQQGNRLHYFVVGGIGCDERKTGDIISGKGTSGKWDYVYNGTHTTIGKLSISRLHVSLNVVDTTTGRIIDRVTLSPLAPVQEEKKSDTLLYE